MFKLTHLINDEQLVLLARDYWTLDSGKTWTFKMSELAQKYGRHTSSIASIVRKSCVAHSCTVLCTRCQEPMEAVSRTAYQALLSEQTSRSKWKRHEDMLCQRCVDENLRERLRQHEVKAERERLAIESWLEKQNIQLQQMDYLSAPAKDAFLLYGLLSSAGMAWQSHHLDAWEEYAPLLFAHNDDINQTYLYLYSKGWIVPSKTSKLSAFEINEEGNVAFYPTRVNWLIAPDRGDTSYNDLLLLLDTMLQRISIEDSREIWFLVCLSELRVYFEELHKRFQFRSNGWTPLVEQNMKLLLRECSVAQAKGIIWSSFKNLLVAQRDSKYKTYHVNNMIPGSFIRTLRSYNDKGYTLTPWTRPKIEQEAVSTSLLFDTVLRGRNKPYDTLNELGFE